jgi:Ca2+-binding RTX toxin-like protein
MSNRRKIYRTVVGPLAAGTAMIAAAAFTAAPAQAMPAGVTVTLNGSLLTITGDSAANSLTVGHTAAGAITLNGTEVLGGTATTANVSDIVMDGGAGNDTLRLDETNGAMPRIKFLGGEGNDQLFGGSGADSLLGGPGADTLVGNGGDDNLVGDAGNDKVIGGPGDDTVSLGDDSDQFTWNPGDGNDHVDGNAGTDTLIFNGSDRAASDPFETEDLSFASDGSRTMIKRSVTRQLPLPSETDLMSLSGFELVKSELAGGPNSVTFDASMPRSDIGVIRVDLGPPIDPTQNRGHDSAAGFTGTEGADGIRIGGSAAAGATVTGLGPTVVLTRAQTLTVVGRGGDDVIDASGLAAGTVTQLIENGNEGNDILIGSPGHDQLFGGPGTDRFEERGGNDLTDAVPGEVVIP